MLSIIIPENEYWNPFKEEFIYTKKTVLNLEHSLISVAKWEGEYQKSFFDENKHSMEEIMNYIKCMTLDKGVDESVYLGINQEILATILAYMNKPMTAATFNDKQRRRPGRSGEKTTAETLYWMMAELGIPYDPCEKWHINRLFALIHFCQVKQTPGKKMPKDKILSDNMSLNALRRAKLNTKG